MQAALDALLAGAPLRLEERYAAAMRTLGLAVLCAPMLPLSPLIALIGERPLPHLLYRPCLIPEEPCKVNPKP